MNRPKEGEVTKIEDTYAYNGDGLRHVADHLRDNDLPGVGRRRKAPADTQRRRRTATSTAAEGLPVEQINSSSGTVPTYTTTSKAQHACSPAAPARTKASCTYDAYGNQTGHTGTATTPLGYDGQYTDTDTGLIYLRAREYDPATAQFLTVDPREDVTLSIYEYACDNPVTVRDPTGEGPEESRVAHEFLSLEDEGLKQLKRKHASSETVEFFQEILKVHLYFELAFAEGNGRDQSAAEKELNHIRGQLVGKFAPLASESISLLKLVKTLRQIYHITVAVRYGSRR